MIRTLVFFLLPRQGFHRLASVLITKPRLYVCPNCDGDGWEPEGVEQTEWERHMGFFPDQHCYYCNGAGSVSRDAFYDWYSYDPNEM
jgi:hypothetical protein